jgi:hypothetical protein
VKTEGFKVGDVVFYDGRRARVTTVLAGEYGQRVEFRIDQGGAIITTTPGLDPRFSAEDTSTPDFIVADGHPAIDSYGVVHACHDNLRGHPQAVSICSSVNAFHRVIPCESTVLTCVRCINTTKAWTVPIYERAYDRDVDLL